MSQRPQRMSGWVITATPFAAAALPFDSGRERAVTMTLGGVPSGGNGWSRRAVPRVTWI